MQIRYREAKKPSAPALKAERGASSAIDDKRHIYTAPTAMSVYVTHVT